MPASKSSAVANLLERYGDWYSASNDPEEVTFGPVSGLSITGQGEPGQAAHMEAVKLLFVVAKEVLDQAATAGVPFSMPPLEGRWWIEDERPWFDVPRHQWRWHL